MQKPFTQPAARTDAGQRLFDVVAGGRVALGVDEDQHTFLHVALEGEPEHRSSNSASQTDHRDVKPANAAHEDHHRSHSGEHDGRTQMRLQVDQHHGGDQNGQSHQHVAPASDVLFVIAQELGQDDDGEQLGQL